MILVLSEWRGGTFELMPVITFGDMSFRCANRIQAADDTPLHFNMQDGFFAIQNLPVP